MKLLKQIYIIVSYSLIYKLKYNSNKTKELSNRKLFMFYCYKLTYYFASSLSNLSNPLDCNKLYQVNHFFMSDF